MRRRVKEQLKKLGGMEFYDVNFSYIDLEDMSEHYVSVPEQGGGKLIPDGMCNPGQVYTVSRGKSGMLGVFRLESQMLQGNGKIERTGCFLLSFPAADYHEPLILSIHRPASGKRYNLIFPRECLRITFIHFLFHLLCRITLKLAVT